MKLILKLFLIGVFFLTVSVDVFAAVGINRKINFQGKVVNKGVGNTDGTNVADGNYNFTFSMWTTLSAGTSIWSEVWSGASQVPVTSGIFQVALGTNSTFPSTVDFNTDSLYVSVNFNGDGDMSPRIQMTAVPYAFNAEKVSGLTIIGTGVSLNQNLTTGDTVTFVSAKFTNIALGTGSTILYIDSSGNLVQGTLPAGGQAYTAGNGLNLVGNMFGLGGTLSENTQIGTSSFSLSFLGLGGTQGLWLDKSGAVGVGVTGNFGNIRLITDSLAVIKAGTTYPGLVMGNLAMNTLDEVGIYESTSDGVLFSYSPSTQLLYYGQSAMIIDPNGKIGLGTTAPTHKLDVIGDVGISTNLGIGGSLSLTGIAVGVGSSLLYIDSSGNIVQGTLPVISVANSKVIVLSPEYAGASLSADGSGTTAVSVTSDNTLNSAGGGWKNYYELTSIEASLQDYSVIVRITLPNDFGTWETGSCPGSTCALEFNYQSGVGTTDDNYVSYEISNDIDTPATAVCSIGKTAATAWNKSGCNESVLNDNVAPEWDAAGETAVVRIKMAAKNTASALTRIGDIMLRYKSVF